LRKIDLNKAYKQKPLQSSRLAGVCSLHDQALPPEELSEDYIPISPIPPPPMPPAGAASLGDSETMHSVVNINDATDAAFCSAVRVTLVGSKMPISITSP
jgi:hypothetical protein